MSHHLPLCHLPFWDNHYACEITCTLLLSSCLIWWVGGTYKVHSLSVLNLQSVALSVRMEEHASIRTVSAQLDTQENTARIERLIILVRIVCVHTSVCCVHVCVVACMHVCTWVHASFCACVHHLHESQQLSNAQCVLLFINLTLLVAYCTECSPPCVWADWGGDHLGCWLIGQSALLLCCSSLGCTRFGLQFGVGWGSVWWFVGQHVYTLLCYCCLPHYPLVHFCRRDLRVCVWWCNRRCCFHFMYCGHHLAEGLSEGSCSSKENSKC